MKRVAIFGNAGGGKSTLALELAAITGLPLYVLDKIKYRPGGGEVRTKNILKRIQHWWTATNGSSTGLVVSGQFGKGLK